jgi:hypothetical protein
MKFNCGETETEKINRLLKERQRLKEWHPFFPLWPRKVGSKDCRAFEWIERKGWWDIYDHCWEWEYRVKQNEHNKTE